MEKEKTGGIAQLAKEELTSVKIGRTCCKRAFLAGIIRGAGNFYVDHEGFGVKVALPSAELIAKCALLVKNLVGNEPEVIMRTSSREVGNKTVYELKLRGDVCFDLLSETGISPAPYQFADGIAPETVAEDCCASAFLRGIFLASGTVSAPPRHTVTAKAVSYYLDFTVNTSRMAEDLKELLARFDVAARIRVRNELYSVYVKDAEIISNLLVRMGAVRAMMELQDILATRSLNNDNNRQINCASANIDKTIDASIRQILAIEKIRSARGLDSLDPALKATAEARLANPETTLSELAATLPGNPSKSCLNHRMRKLLAIAAEIDDNGGNA